MGPFQRSIILAGVSALLAILAPPLFGSHDIACAQVNGSPNSAGDTAEYNQLVLLYNNRHFEPMAEHGPLLWQRIVAYVPEDGHEAIQLLQMIIDANHKLGRYPDAIKYELRLVEISDRHAAPAWGAVYTAAIATDYAALGRFAEAERLYKGVLAFYEEKSQHNAHNMTDLGTTLYDLAEVYRNQGRYEDAEPLFKRALAIREKAPRQCAAALNGRCQRVDVVSHSEALSGLASVYRIEGRYADAEQLLKQALAITEKLNGGDYQLHPMQPNLYALGVLYKDMGRPADADQYLKPALSLLDRPGLDVPYASPQYAFEALDALGEVNTGLGHYAEARGYDERALVLARNVYGERHLAVARTLSHLAELNRATGDLAGALALSRSAVEIATAAMNSASAAVNVAVIRPEFELHLGILAQARAANVESSGPGSSGPGSSGLGSSGFADEALDAAQSASQSSAGAALNQMAARFGAGNDLLAQLVRERQDTARELEAANKAMVGGLAAADRSADTTRSLRGHVAELGQKLNGLDKRLATEFPDYAALASPQPLKSAEIRQLLGPDEGLLFYLAGEKQSYVFALTRESVDWRTIPIGAKELSDRVSAFRRGLSLTASASDGLFDLAGAHDLYRALIGPVEAAIEGKKQLLVVPSGVLTALPFDLLVTEKPSGAVPSMDNLAPYRDAAWLIKSHAITVLPSVASLKALRILAHRDEATKPMVGFGAPQFDPNASVASTDTNVTTASRTLTTRSFTDFFHGAGVDRARLAHALPPLPDTADELKAVGKDLNAPSTDIHLGKDASETVLKRLPLSDYRIVYFATHGLVAGDIRGLAEPSLALSIPAQPSDLDDGLLTASEVAQLKLNADWVVLSACNTVAGDKPGAEALSGLARAFFYAGARALLVSHWAVDSSAATRLTTSTFDLLKSNPKLGRAEALQRAMLAYLNDPSDAKNAYPAFWAPFEIVGDGAAH